MRSFVRRRPRGASRADTNGRVYSRGNAAPVPDTLAGSGIRVLVSLDGRRTVPFLILVRFADRRYVPAG